MDSTPHDDVICDLLIQLAEDDLAGGVRSLGDYLRRFPGHEVSVAREYVAFIDNQRSARSTNEDLSLAPTHELIERLREARGAGLRYRIEREIARGGMGSVLQVHDTELAHGKHLGQSLSTRSENNREIESSRSGAGSRNGRDRRWALIFHDALGRRANIS
jgi:hypothetical protein